MEEEHHFYNNDEATIVGIRAMTTTWSRTLSDMQVGNATSRIQQGNTVRVSAQAHRRGLCDRSMRRCGKRSEELRPPRPPAPSRYSIYIDSTCMPPL